MKQIISVLLLLATAQHTFNAMDLEQDELEQALAVSAEQYEREQAQRAQQDIDEELEFAKALSISGQEEVEKQRRQAADRRETLAKAAEVRLKPQAQQHEGFYDDASLAGLPVELQEKIFLAVLSSEPTLKQGIRSLFKLARSNRQLFELLTNESFIEQVKKLIQQRNQQAELNSLLILYSQISKLPAVRFLLHLGADVNTIEDGKTALIHAVMMGYHDIVQALINAGAEVNVAYNNETALMIAARGVNHKMVQILLAAKAKVNAADSFGWTALIVAAWNGYPEIVRLLLAAGADVHAMDIDGKPVLHYAYDSKNQEVIKLIQDAINKR